MKKMILAIAAAMMMSVTMTAQENVSEKKEDMKRPDMTEMVKQRTDETVKKYGLNEEQAAKLLELNTKYSDRMGGPRRGQRPDGMRRGRGMRPDSARFQAPRQREEMKGDRQERRDAPAMREGRPDFRKQMEEYDAEIQKIMTEEQYEKYKSDREQRMKEGPRGFRRNR